jgi:hypothetical protein
MYRVSWEHSGMLIAMLASMSFPTSSSPKDLESDGDNSKDTEPSNENQQEPPEKPRKFGRSPRRGGWSFRLPWPFGRRPKPGGSR